MGPQDASRRPPKGERSAWGGPAPNHTRPVFPVTDQPRPPPQGVPMRAPTHPGRFLEKQYLVPLGINQTRAAVLLGVSRRRVNELVMGHRAMSPDTALRCAQAFGWPAAHWLALQSEWDAWTAWQSIRQAHAGPRG